MTRTGRCGGDDARQRVLFSHFPSVYSAHGGEYNVDELGTLSCPFAPSPSPPG